VLLTEQITLILQLTDMTFGGGREEKVAYVRDTLVWKHKNFTVDHS